MSDFPTPAAPDATGHAEASTAPESATAEQPEIDVDSFASTLDKAAAAMVGETSKDEPAPPASGQETPSQPAPPVQEQSERMIKLKVAGEEKELPESEVLKLASAGADYTRKTQELARERDRITALDALAKRLEADPAFRDHVFSYGRGPAPDQEAPPHTDQPPTDPVERLKWEAVQQAKAEIMREMAPIAEQIPVIQAMQRIESTKALVRQDPAGEQVVKAMHAYVNAQPAPFREQIFRELDSNPEAFLDVYRDFRGRLAKMASQQKAAAPAATPPHTKVAPPVLESGGNSAPAVPAGSEKSVRELRREIKAGTAGPDAIGRLLEASGAMARMGFK